MILLTTGLWGTAWPCQALLGHMAIAALGLDVHCRSRSMQKAQAAQAAAGSIGPLPQGAGFHRKPKGDGHLPFLAGFNVFLTNALGCLTMALIHCHSIAIHPMFIESPAFTSYLAVVYLHSCMWDAPSFLYWDW